MNRFVASTQHLFDHHGTAYDRITRPLTLGLYRRVVADAAGTVPRGGTVLDVGAGPGRLAIALATHRPDLTVHAVDIAPDMVRVARENVARAGLTGRVHVEHTDGAALPLPDGGVDLVVSTASFHHWADVPAVVRELRRVVSPSGRVWLYDFRRAPWQNLTGALGAPVVPVRSGLLFSRAEFRAG